MANYQVSNDLVEIIEKTLRERMMARLKRIVWGVNVHSVQEALTFSEGYLFGAVTDEARELVGNYLFQNGFMVCGRPDVDPDCRVWTFPKKPEGWMAKVYRAFDDSYQTAINAEEIWVREDLRQYLSGSQNLHLQKLFNGIRRQKALEEVKRCGKHLFAKLTPHQDWIYMGKNERWEGVVDNLIHKSENDYHNSFESTLGCFYRMLGSKIDWQLQELALLKAYPGITRYHKNPGHYLFYVSFNVANEFVTMLEGNGFMISYFPVYPEELYDEIWVKEHESIELYVSFPEDDVSRVRQLCYNQVGC